MPALIIEESPRHGGPVRRHRLERLPATIGRSYGCDCIIDDPYVSALHLRIEEGENGWTAVDAGSENGTFLATGQRLEGPCLLVSGDRLCIGRTLLRFFASVHAVPPALPLPRRRSFARQAAGPLAALFTLLLASGVVLHVKYLDIVEKVRPVTLLTETLPTLMFPLIWAGVWAAAGFMIRRKPRFCRQLVAANLALILLQASATLSEYLDFFSGNVFLADSFRYAGMAVIGAIMLSVNILIASGRVTLRRSLVVSAVAVGFVGFQAITALARVAENPVSPVYSRSLKPPPARIVRAVTLDQFMAQGRDRLADPPASP